MGREQDLRWGIIVSIIVAVLTTAGCTSPTPAPAEEGPGVPAVPQAATLHALFRIGDRATYLIPNGDAVTVRIAGSTSVSTDGDAFVEAVPLMFTYRRAEAENTLNFTAFISPENGRVILHLWECADLVSDGNDGACTGFQPILFALAGSPAPLLLTSAWPIINSGQTEMEILTVEGGHPQTLPFAVSDVAMAGVEARCTELRYVGNITQQNPYHLPLFWSTRLAATFCADDLFPTHIEILDPHPVRLERVAYEPGQDPIQIAWSPSLPEWGEMPGRTFIGALNVVPPEGPGPGPFLGLAEALREGRERDAGLDEFLSAHPDAILRGSHEPARGNISGPSTPAGSAGPLDERHADLVLQIGVPGALEYYEVRVRKSTGPLNMTSYLVVDSGFRTADTPSPSSLEGLHLFFSEAIRRAEELMGAPTHSAGVITVIPPHPGGNPFVFEDRFLYRMTFNGPTTGIFTFLAVADIDSRTGGWVQLNAPPEIIRNFVPGQS